MVRTVQPQSDMKRTTLYVGMRCSGEEESSAVHDSSVYIGHVSLLSVRRSQSMHTRLSLLSMYMSVKSWIKWFTLDLAMKEPG